MFLNFTVWENGLENQRLLQTYTDVEPPFRMHPGSSSRLVKHFSQSQMIFLREIPNILGGK